MLNSTIVVHGGNDECVNDNDDDNEDDDDDVDLLFYL